MAKPFYGFQPTAEQNEIIAVIEDYLRGKKHHAIINAEGLPMFDHNHLQAPEGGFSTHFEDVISYRDELAYAVSEAIMDGEIKLPEGVSHEVYSSIEMYFWRD